MRGALRARTSRALPLVAVLVVASGCRSGEADPATYAAEVWRVRCAACHGAAGEGVARVGVAMPSFRDAEWQRRTGDDAIERIVAEGGARVGKSSIMPANPDLARSPAVLQAMRARVRGFARDGGGAMR